MAVRQIPASEPTPETRQQTAVKTIAFFAHDSGESVVIKRAKAFQASGASVTGFMFHRVRDKARPTPVWHNISLGDTVDRNYLARLPKLCAGLWKVLRHRRELAACDVIYARNFDMMAIATAAKWLTRSRARLVYEVLDIQRAFVGTGAVSAVFRWCERRLLAACDMLVVSSPMFMTRYFEPQQGYTGAWYLLENKVTASQLTESQKSVPDTAPAPGPPWIIGWFGTLRCTRSLDILGRLAAIYPDKVAVQIRGTLSEEDISRDVMQAATAGRANFRYFGPYESPRDLPEIYSQIHFTWAIDFLDANSNSDWLLPNRLYEGGLFNAVPIARAGTATGDKVVRDGLGVTLAEPIDEALAAWLLGMDAEQFDALHDAARRAPRSLFIDETDTASLLEAVAQTGNERPAAKA
ncbi:glycosyltransferase [Hyphomicrobium sp. CS1GBMeth3]|uniref:glycosyltransferase n=1 Tax=Hyphomicrobium sp. CS1GBMeth3 TaxID=1892845 RepID=UPI0009311D10|nr:glycosyltransferase [Hyphomicrobium sp. CS1GBMeth3]